MVSLSYGYTITYKNGWERNVGGSQWMIVNVQEGDYLKIVEGTASGIGLMEIPGIEHIREQMMKDVLWDDSWHNTNGTKRNSMLKKPREYQRIVMFLEPGTIRHIRSMKNPMEEMTRPEQKMTVYRSDGSYVTISYRKGTIYFVDSRKKGGSVSMTADAFLDWFVH